MNHDEKMVGHWVTCEIQKLEAFREFWEAKEFASEITLSDEHWIHQYNWWRAGGRTD